MNRKLHEAAGYTLIELVVTAALGVVVLAIAASFFLGASNTSTSVKTASNAAGLGQLVARSVDQGVRNATAVTTSVDALSGAEMLLARSLVMDPSQDPSTAGAASCIAWYYSPLDGGAIYTRRTHPAAPIAMPAGAPGAGWIQLGEGVDLAVDAAVGSTIFSTPAGDQVNLKFDVRNGVDPMVRIDSTTQLLNPNTESAPCF